MAELNVPGFKIHACIHTSAYGGIYKATNLENSAAVILKVAVKAVATAEHLIQLRNEYDTLKTLSGIENIPEALQLVDKKEILALELSHFSGLSIDTLTAQGKLSVDKSVTILQSALKALNLVHAHHVIHKDIKPNNLLWDEQNSKVWLIDFGLAIRFNQKMDQFYQPASVSGSLSYMAPEQTGRINRAVDYRSDYYALGVTAYHLLTGELPFKSTQNTHEFLYQLLTKEAKAPDKITSDIPESLAHIVMHLLEKEPENRYQTIAGIQYDLTHYQDRNFIVGSHDVAEHFAIPNNVYGRDNELNQLRECFNKVAGGRQQNVLIAGYSGVGKTALVHELCRDVSNAQGYLIEGKFDQLQRDEPLFGFIKAFDEFFAALLTESDQTLAHWRQLLLKNLGENAGVVTQHITNLERLLGVQPKPLYLAGEEGFNRLIFSFESLISCIASPNHPLVMFIDDLQWVDDASLKLIKTLFYSGSNPYCMLIGAYRDNEVKAGHPLYESISKAEVDGIKFECLTLGNLNQTALEQILEEGFQSKLPTVTELSKLLFKKTGGNPFFTMQLIHSLVDEGSIYLDESSNWSYDLDKIRLQSIADNLVELMQQKIKSFSGDTSKLLSIAAVLGHEFDLASLQQISDKSADDVTSALLPALQSDLIIAKQDQFRFAHDGIQEAALENVNSEERKQFHQQVGHILLTRSVDNPPLLKAEIFNICFHLNICQGEDLTPSQAKQLIELNQIAAKKAKQSAAYETGYHYINSAKSILTSASPELLTLFGFEIYKEAAECAYLCNDTKQGDEYITSAETYAKQNHQKFQLFVLKVTNLIQQGEYVRGMELGLTALGLYGINMPDVSDDEQIDQYYIQQQQTFNETWRKKNQSIAALYDLPTNHDEEIEQLMALLGELYASALMSFPNYLKAITITLVNLSIENGNTSSSPVAYAWHGSSIASVSDDYDDAYEFAELAIRLNEQKIKNPTIACKIYNMVGNFITFFKKPLRQTLPQLRRAYELGMSSGDKLYGGYSIINELRNSLSTGMTLNDWLALDDEVKQKLEQCDAHVMVEVRESFRSHALRLTGHSNGKDKLDNENFNEFEYREKYASVPLFGVLLDSWKIQSDYLLGCYQQAKKLSLFDVTPIDSFVLGSEMRFYAALTLLNLANEEKTNNKATDDLDVHRAHIDKYLAQIKTLSQHCPENFAHLHEMLRGEHERVLGNHMSAASHFESAILLAKQNEYIQYQALAHELLGRLYLSMALNESGRVQIKQAHELYGFWGSTAKQKQLENHYPQFDLIGSSLHSNRDLGSGLISKTAITQRIDLKSVIDASLALSSEMDLKKLLNQLIEIALKSTGAQKCVLLIPTQESWQVAMEQSSAAQQNNALQLASPENKLPLSVLNFVAHSKQDLVLANALSDKLYGKDSYVIENETKSLVCLPLIHQEQTRAIIYLENNLSSNVFSQDKTSRLKLLSAQMAASILNAKNYQKLVESEQQLHALNQSLEQKVATRTHELETALAHLKSSQKQMIEQEKLASLGRLVAGVAHEVNTPLGVSILGNSFLLSSVNQLEDKFNEDALRKNDLEEFIETAKEATEQIEFNLKRASELVSNFKQMASDFHSDPKCEIDLVDWISSVSNSLLPMLNSASIKLQLELPKVPLYVTTYPSRVAQVITNLVSNAISHAYPEGFDSKQKLITIRLVGNATQYSIAVIDNGIGMDKDTKAQVLEPFFTTSRKSGGMGLGMSIVHNLVTTSLEGRLVIDSEKEQGTTITIHFSGSNNIEH